MAKRVYKISWGRSVYYKEQFKPENFHQRIFARKVEALSFLKKLNKRKDVDFSNLDYGYYPLKLTV
jgi:hypothetical protein